MKPYTTCSTFAVDVEHTTKNRWFELLCKLIWISLCGTYVLRTFGIEAFYMQKSCTAWFTHGSVNFRMKLMNVFMCSTSYTYHIYVRCTVRCIWRIYFHLKFHSYPVDGIAHRWIEPTKCTWASMVMPEKILLFN